MASVIHQVNVTLEQYYNSDHVVPLLYLPIFIHKGTTETVNLLQNGCIVRSLLDTFICHVGYSMVETMLEKHLAEDFEASKGDISFTFFLFGLAYTVASILIACVCLA